MSHDALSVAEQLEQLLDEQLTDADQQRFALHVKCLRSCQATLESLTATALSGRLVHA